MAEKCENTGRCCCGKYDEVDDKMLFAANGIVHERLGKEGAFCGPTDKHTIRFLENKITELEKDRERLAGEVERLKASNEKVSDEVNSRLLESKA